MNFLKLFSGWFVFFVFVSFVIPVSWNDVNHTKTVNESHPSGTISVTTTMVGDHVDNVWGVVLSHDYTNSHVVQLKCNTDTTVITGYTRYRAPDAQMHTFYCEADGTLEFKMAGGWITLAAKGMATKVSLSTYNLRPKR